MRRVDPFPRAFLALLPALLFAAGSAHAATITIINNDGANEGLNDPTPAAPVGGNPGTTVGAQRQFVLAHAASIWGSILPSRVAIKVLAHFDPLTCDATSAVLGRAGPRSLLSDFPGAEFSNTWYPQALANKLAGADQDPSLEDIDATFNSDVDNSTCLGAAKWYYGVDGNEGPDVELLPVILHELGHGLGFTTEVNASTGQLLSNMPDVFSRFMFDRTLGLHWNQMSDAQRAGSAVNTGNLVWDGQATTLQAPSVLEHRPEVLVLSPGSIAGSYAAAVAAFGPPTDATGITADVVLVDDGTSPASDACQPLLNGAQLGGNIALIDRGTCDFVSKVKAAQVAGAIGTIVVNNVGGPPVGMAGTDPTITIPSVMISLADGTAIKNALAGGTVSATLRRDPTLLAGADPQNRLLLYAPNPAMAGASLSHFDTSALPNLLMEPAISASLHDSVDLTRQVFEDIGWQPRGSPIDSTAAAPALRVQNAPNPFVPSTVISVELPAAGATRVEIFDARGRFVRRLLDSWMPAGIHAVTWDGTDERGSRLGAGVYFSRVRSNGRDATRTLVKLNG